MKLLPSIMFALTYLPVTVDVKHKDTGNSGKRASDENDYTSREWPMLPGHIGRFRQRREGQP